MTFSFRSLRFLIGFGWLAIATVGHPAAVYKYRNADGIVSFTDQPTKGAKVLYYGDRFVEKLDTRVRIETRRETGTETLILVNELHAPVEVELSLSHLDNVAELQSSRIHGVVSPQSRTPLVDLTPAQPGPLHYRHKLRFALSDPSLQQATYQYALPWSSGQYKVSQGPNGKFSHQDDKGKFAVDIVMPQGTRIVAARDGVVVSLDSKQREGNGSKAGNYVRILHNDGTMSVYLHLQRNGVLVQEGQSIKTGDPIAYSGNTGSSTGAHLHFVVQKNIGMNVVSIPFLFADPGGIARTPQAGDWLGTSEVATR